MSVHINNTKYISFIPQKLTSVDCTKIIQILTVCHQRNMASIIECILRKNTAIYIVMGVESNEIALNNNPNYN